MHFVTHNAPDPRHFVTPHLFLKTDSGCGTPNLQRQLFVDQRHSTLNLDELCKKLEQNGEEALPLLDLSQKSSCHHDCKSDGCNRVTINVAGQKFETQLKTLNRLPDTLLGNPEKRRKFWDPIRKEYFFDRHRPSFPAILYYYQSGGRLRRPLEVPTDIFVEEMTFYELDNSVIYAYKRSEGYILTNECHVMPSTKWRRILWKMFEYPESSIPARIVAILSVLFILISVVSFCVETLPEFQGSGCANATNSSKNGTTTNEQTIDLGDPLFIIETVCIIWFIIELGMRLIFCPSKKDFFKGFINWIDFLAIVPYFVFIISFAITKSCTLTEKTGAFSVLRVLRVVRILKLSKHSEGLKVLGKTFTSSVRELTMFLLFLGIAVVIFSGAVYYTELQESGTHFKSIPDAFWWAIVTMTTVGYGDLYPVGALGKIIGAFCVISGLLAIALPVPVIVTNFNNFYHLSTGRGCPME